MCITLNCGQKAARAGVSGPAVEDVKVGDEMKIHGIGDEPDRTLFVQEKVLQIPDKS